MKKSNYLKNAFIASIILGAMYLIAVFGIAFDDTVSDYSLIIPINLIVMFGVMILFNRNGIMSIGYLLAIYFSGFFVEALGVNTGWIFGEYKYLSVMGLKVFETPLLIGINWVILIFGVADITNRFQVHPLFRILLGAGLMLIFDVALEPNAIRMEMWQWKGGNIPTQNYLAWYAISALMLIPASKILKRPNPVASSIFLLQLAFFLVLNLIYSYR